VDDDDWMALSFFFPPHPDTFYVDGSRFLLLLASLNRWLYLAAQHLLVCSVRS
jgi:hypothetical protein